MGFEMEFDVEDGRKKRKFIRIFVKALASVPDKVINFLSKYPILFHVHCKDGQVQGYTFSREIFKKYKAIITLNSRIWKFSEKDIIEIIHHEIAHNFLGHMKWASTKKHNHNEREVEKTIKKWNEKREIELIFR